MSFCSLVVARYCLVLVLVLHCIRLLCAICVFVFVYYYFYVHHFFQFFQSLFLISFSFYYTHTCKHTRTTPNILRECISVCHTEFELCYTNTYDLSGTQRWCRLLHCLVPCLYVQWLAMVYYDVCVHLWWYFKRIFCFVLYIFLRSFFLWFALFASYFFMHWDLFSKVFLLFPFKDKNQRRYRKSSVKRKFFYLFNSIERNLLIIEILSKARDKRKVKTLKVTEFKAKIIPKSNYVTTYKRNDNKTRFLVNHYTYFRISLIRKNTKRETKDSRTFEECDIKHLKQKLHIFGKKFSMDLFRLRMKTAFIGDILIIILLFGSLNAHCCCCWNSRYWSISR